MRTRIWNIVTGVVPLLIIAVLVPWGAPSDEEFFAGAKKAVTVAVLAFVTIRYAWPLLDRQIPQRGIGTGNVLRYAMRFTPWMIAFWGLVASMGIVVLIELLIGRFGARSDFLLMMLVTGQQLVLALATMWIGRVATGQPRAPSYLLPLVAVSVLAAWFSLAMPTLLDALSHNRESEPLEYRNLAWCVPTLLLSIFVALRAHRIRSRSAEGLS